jgi:Glycosyl hydrolase family 14
MKRPRFHTRHIPEDHLDFTSRKAHEVRRNGLCDVLKPDNLRRLKDCGVRLVETRLTWWECEPMPGRADWTRLAHNMSRILRAGLKVGLHPWFQHPPPWYNEADTGHVRFRCLEHDEDSTILSIWDPRTLEIYHRLYTALAERFGSAFDFFLVGITGDCGEVSYPTGTDHYAYSPPHGHEGYWCGDPLARQSFAEAMLMKYGSLDLLNEAWGTSHTSIQDDFMPRLPLSVNSIEVRCDFMRWYTRSLTHFTARVCTVFQAHFPDTPAAIPVGGSSETLPVGQIKSQVARVAAHHSMMVRSTEMGSLRTFARSNIIERRLASAARHYGAEFGVEAPLGLSAQGAADNLYECLANGAAVVHEDPLNIMQSLDVQLRLRPRLVVDLPCSRIALFYPVENEMLAVSGAVLSAFIAHAAELRPLADYEICDSYMIWDGFLRGITDLIFVTGCIVPHYTAHFVVDFVRAGGRAWLYRGARVSQLFDERTLLELAESAGLPVLAPESREVPAEAGFYTISEWPAFEPYASLREQLGLRPESFVTVHESQASYYEPQSGTFDVTEYTPTP